MSSLCSDFADFLSIFPVIHSVGFFPPFQLTHRVSHWANEGRHLSLPFFHHVSMAFLKSLKLGFFRYGQSNISASFLNSWYLSFHSHWVLTALRIKSRRYYYGCARLGISACRWTSGAVFMRKPATPFQCPGTSFCHMQSMSVSFTGTLGDWINWKCSLFSHENKSWYSCKNHQAILFMPSGIFSVQTYTVLKKQV